MKSLTALVTLFAMFMGSVGMVGAASAEKNVSLSSMVLDENFYFLDLSIQLPSDTPALLLFAEPSHAFLGLMVSPSADPLLIDSVRQEKPLSETIADLGNDTVQAVIAYSPGRDTHFVFLTATIVDKTLVKTSIAEIYPSSFDEFNFGFISYPDSLGCYSSGQCPNGRPIIGPWCNPCIFTLCCYGPYGYIQCGDVLCH